MWRHTSVWKQALLLPFPLGVCCLFVSFGLEISCVFGQKNKTKLRDSRKIPGKENMKCSLGWSKIEDEDSKSCTSEQSREQKSRGYVKLSEVAFGDTIQRKRTLFFIYYIKLQYIHCGYMWISLSFLQYLAFYRKLWQWLITPADRC